MKHFGTVLGLISLVGVGVLGFLGQRQMTELSRDLNDSRNELVTLRTALSTEAQAGGQFRDSFETYAQTINDRLERLQDTGESTLKDLGDRFQALDDQIAERLLGHVRKEEITTVLEDYRTEIIKKASRNVVYVVNGSSGAGSGFFVNDSGRVLTNCHVVGRAKSATLMTWDEHWVEANVIARDAATDLAVLQVVEEDLEKLREDGCLPEGSEFADSEQVEVGDYVFTMGAPHNLTQTVNAGQVSNTSRYLQGLPILDRVSGLYNLYFQVDAGVMPGNSGGPSFDIQGRIIGINTRANYQNEAEGFVIPINFALERARAMIEAADKKNHYNTLGFDLNPYLKKINEAGSRPKILPQEYTSAIHVGRVFTDSPAYEKGFRTGDLILEINGEPVDLNVQGDIVALRRDIAFGDPGTSYTFKVIHAPKMNPKTRKIIKKGEIETITLTVLDADEYTLPVGVNELLAYFNALQDDEIPEDYEDGVKFVDGYTTMDRKRRIKKGQPAIAYPFKRGDILVEVEGAAVEGLGGLTKTLQTMVKARRLPQNLTVIRQGSKVQLTPIRNNRSGRTPPKTNPPTKPKDKPSIPKRKTEIF